MHKSRIVPHDTLHCAVARELIKMTLVQFRNLRDERDDARREIKSASRNSVKALEYRHYAYDAWRVLAKAVKDGGCNVFLPYKISCDGTWCIQSISPDTSEKYIGTFQTEIEAQSWISKNLAT